MFSAPNDYFIDNSELNNNNTSTQVCVVKIEWDCFASA